MKDVNSDQQNAGLQLVVDIDRDTAARLGITTAQIDQTLYDAFGQRQVATYFTQVNQYRVILEASPAIGNGPDALERVFVSSASGAQVPLSARTAQAFQESMKTQKFLVTVALLVVYLVLGILYESYVHPITILSTIPSAGLGALLALLMFGSDLNLIAMVGIILLVGIVKKNAILMIDFAIELERDGRPPEEAIYEAARLRFRPILMTTMPALLGALPLALGTGIGSELRRPLGLAIVGGLLVSQVLTLFTTPVTYLAVHRFTQATGPAVITGRA